MQETKTAHYPVLLGEVTRELKVARFRECKYIDATLGFGGHTAEILKQGGIVLGIEDDKTSIEIAQERISKELGVDVLTNGRLKIVLGNFNRIDVFARKNAFSEVDGIVYDLGVNIYQLTSKSYGMSFMHPESSLDMRINKQAQKVTARDLINVLRRDQLIDLFKQTLSLGKAAKLADEILKARKLKTISKVGELIEVSQKVVAKSGKINSATNIFLALRIAVNSELENLRESLPKAFNLIKKGGRMVIISFHSGEDRIVKEFSRNLENLGVGIVSELITPSSKEVSENPSSRSAKMRVIEKR